MRNVAMAREIGHLHHARYLLSVAIEIRLGERLSDQTWAALP